MPTFSIHREFLAHSDPSNRDGRPFTEAEVQARLSANKVEHIVSKVLIFGNSRTGKSELCNVLAETSKMTDDPNACSIPGTARVSDKDVAEKSSTASTILRFHVTDQLKAGTTASNRALVVLIDDDTAEPVSAFLIYNVNGFSDSDVNNRQNNNKQITEAIKDCAVLGSRFVPFFLFFVVGVNNVSGVAFDNSDLETYRTFHYYFKETLSQKLFANSSRFSIILNKCDTEDEEFVEELVDGLRELKDLELGADPQTAWKEDKRIVVISDQIVDYASERAAARALLWQALHRQIQLLNAVNQNVAPPTKEELQAIFDGQGNDEHNEKLLKTKTEKDQHTIVTEKEQFKEESQTRKAAYDTLVVNNLSEINKLTSDRESKTKEAEKEIDDIKKKTKSIQNGWAWTGVIVGAISFCCFGGVASLTKMVGQKLVSSAVTRGVIQGASAGIVGSSAKALAKSDSDQD